MLQRLIAGFVINFILAQLAKLEGIVDWDKLKADLDDQVRALVPGTWFDEMVVGWVNAIIDACHQVLNSSDELKQIMQLLVDQKYQEALDALKKLVLELLGNPDASEHQVKAAEILASL